jgi:hypothetical protein
MEVNAIGRTATAQIEPPPEKPNVRFPKVIRIRRAESTIYGKKLNYPFYRIAYYIAGKCVTRHFKTYGETKACVSPGAAANFRKWHCRHTDSTADR